MPVVVDRRLGAEAADDPDQFHRKPARPPQSFAGRESRLAAPWRRVSPRLSGHLVHHVAFARVLGHSQADLLSRTGFGHRLMLDLHGLDLLADIARVAENADR